jgi:hypothetical protein
MKRNSKLDQSWAAHFRAWFSLGGPAVSNNVKSVIKYDFRLAHCPHIRNS